MRTLYPRLYRECFLFTRLAKPFSLNISSNHSARLFETKPDWCLSQKDFRCITRPRASSARFRSGERKKNNNNSKTTIQTKQIAYSLIFSYTRRNNRTDRQTVKQTNPTTSHLKSVHTKENLLYFLRWRCWCICLVERRKKRVKNTLVWWERSETRKYVIWKKTQTRGQTEKSNSSLFDDFNIWYYSLIYQSVLANLQRRHFILPISIIDTQQKKKWKKES